MDLANSTVEFSELPKVAGGPEVRVDDACLF